VFDLFDEIVKIYPYIYGVYPVNTEKNIKGLKQILAWRLKRSKKNFI